MNNKLKRILISIISALLCVSMIACGKQNDEQGKDTTTSASGDVTTTAPDGEDISADEATTTAPIEGNVAIVDPKVDANTFGGTLWNAFLTAKEANPNITAEEMANQLITHASIQFSGGAMALEPAQEYFSGFGEYQIKDYESGALFMPMIGSIPFIGYIFELPEGADVDTFIKNLSDHANPNWNICVTADQTVIGAYGTTVFFLMCPNSSSAE